MKGGESVQCSCWDKFRINIRTEDSIRTEMLNSSDDSMFAYVRASNNTEHDKKGGAYLDAVLRGLGLLLAHAAQHGHKADVHEQHVVAPGCELELPQRL